MKSRVAMGLALCAPLAAQESAYRSVGARVTAVSSASVYLDVGRDAGVEPGDRARALPLGGAPIELVVRSVSRQSARCEFVAAPAHLEVGASVDVFVPAGRAPETAGEVAWTHPTELWSSEMPLLAPAQARTAADREPVWRGRWYGGFDATFEDVHDEQRYWLARTGLELEADNLLGRGDLFRFEGELAARDAEVGDGQDDSDTRARVERLSWREGGTRERPLRLEVGRFLHSEMPQLGLLDGVEVVQRLANGARIGASVGFLPEWSAELSTGEDAAVSVFARVEPDDEGRCSLGAALQKSWHSGDPDRDVFFADASWRPSDALSLALSAAVDRYGSHDAPKASGFELSEAHANASYRYSARGGVGLSLTHLRWPVLLRDELPPVTQATLADGEVQRASASTWRNVGALGRAYLRADAWDSHTDSGAGGELSYAQRDWLWRAGEVGAALFTSEGEFSELDGARVWGSRNAAGGYWTITYEIARHDGAGFAAAQGELAQQAVRASWHGRVGGFDLSLRADQRLGDQQDSTQLGIWLQRRW